MKSTASEPGLTWLIYGGRLFTASEKQISLFSSLWPLFFLCYLQPLSLETYSNVNLLMMNFQVDFDVVLDNLKKLRENCKKSWEYLSIVAKHDSAKQFKSKWVPN